MAEPVQPMEMLEVEKIIESETGAPISRSFVSFESTPLCVSTLAQSHVAVLNDHRRVLVKVQRPHVSENMYEDLEALDEVAKFYDQHTEAGRDIQFHSIVEELSKIIIGEFDYRQEARNLKAVQDNLKEMDRIIVPTPIEHLSTQHVLTMTFVDGKIITETSIGCLLRSERTKLAQQIFDAYLRQILVDGLVHAHPEPTNILLTLEGKVALLDLGVVATSLKDPKRPVATFAGC